jgi:hypothetical protein
MNGDGERKMDPVLRTLIFWLLGALFVVMTGIGGATASHMVQQNDEILRRVSNIEASQAADEAERKDQERRIESIERKLFR